MLKALKGKRKERQWGVMFLKKILGHCDKQKNGFVQSIRHPHVATGVSSLLFCTDPNLETSPGKIRIWKPVQGKSET